MDNNDIADIFEDDNIKKLSRSERKLNKIKEKQDKIEKAKRENNRLLDNEEKKNMPKDIKYDKIEQKRYNFEENNKLEYKKLSKENKPKEKINIIDFLYDTLFAFITILLFLTSIGYLLYKYYKDNTQNNIIIGALLVTTGLFYMLSMFTKGEKLKKIFSIITSLSLMGFMALELFLI